MAGSRSPIRSSFSLRSVPRTYRRPSLRSASPPLRLLSSASQHRLRASNLALSLALSGGREYNMTDGHSRTNTVGHRAVRGRRMPPDVACSALRARLTCVCVARSRGVLRRTQGDREKSPSDSDTRGSIPVCKALTRRVSTCLYARRLAGLVWRYPPLLFSPLPLLSLRPPSPLPRLTRNTTQAAPEAGNETHVWHYFRSGQSGRSAQTSARHLSAVASNHRQSAPLFGVFKHGRCAAWRRRALLEIHSRSRRFPRMPDNQFF